MMWSAKVFTRALFVKCMQNVEISAGQFGLGKSAGVDFPLLMVTQLMEWSKIQDQPLAWWFIDVKTAFDRIIRELLLRPGKDLSLQLLISM
eukprot:414153-Amphidinium_carterae.1